LLLNVSDVTPDETGVATCPLLKKTVVSAAAADKRAQQAEAERAQRSERFIDYSFESRTTGHIGTAGVSTTARPR